MASYERSGVLVLLLALSASLPSPGAAFYLPGLAPVSFCEPGKETTDCKVSCDIRGLPTTHTSL